ncbi:MAG TPA: MFS transporter, partial [Streptosporangiaceae bacterium]|nr:MFS transporter [Streptosporangiaceae bacterium]
MTIAASRRAGLTRLTLGGALLTGGIVAVAFNMRGSITGLPPLFPELSAVAGMPAATQAALAAVPVLGFGVFSGVAPSVARKLGEERALGLALVLLVIGLGLRSAAPGVLLFPGTIIASCAIAFLNVLLPSLIKRRRPERAGLLIGIYLLALTGGAVLGAVIAVPVFNAAGGSAVAVRLTLGIWALPAAVAALVWAPQLRFRTSPPGEAPQGVPGGRPPGQALRGVPGGRPPGQALRGVPGGRPPGQAPRGVTGGRPPGQAPRAVPGDRPPGTEPRRGVIAMSRHALAWQVTLFMGLQSLSYYA